MQDRCTKQGETCYFSCRKDAAKYNDALNSRAGAAEKLNVSESSLRDYETGLTPVPVDVVVRIWRYGSMKQGLSRVLRQIYGAFRRHSHKAMTVTACLVVFVMVYSLILPALTIDQNAAAAEPGIAVSGETQSVRKAAAKGQLTAEKVAAEDSDAVAQAEADAKAAAEAAKAEAEKAEAAEAASDADTQSSGQTGSNEITTGQSISAEQAAGSQDASENTADQNAGAAAARDDRAGSKIADADNGAQQSGSSDAGSSAGSSSDSGATGKSDAVEKSEQDQSKQNTDTMPAVDLEQVILEQLEDGQGTPVQTYKVTVRAEEGTFPAGTTMELRELTTAEYNQKLEETLNRTLYSAAHRLAVSYEGIDITFRDSKGTEIQPEKPLAVRITAGVIRLLEEPKLVHISQNTQTKEITGGELLRDAKLVNESEEDHSTGAENTFAFRMNRFSPFIIAETEEADDENLPAYLDSNSSTHEADAEQNEAQPEIVTDMDTDSSLDEKTGIVGTIAAGAQDTDKQDTDLQTLTAEENGCTITVTFGADAEIPEGATLHVTEILPQHVNYQNYYEQAMAEADAALSGANEEYARIFDIEIRADGKKIEPAAEVAVNIQIPDAPELEDADLQVVHFGETGPEVVESATSEAAAEGETEVTFETDAFSVYAVVYTVDFEYEIDGQKYAFSLDGGESIDLADLLEKLGICEDEDSAKEFIDQIADVIFSDPKLVEVIHKTPILGIFGSERWTLKSLAPFDTEETLTITLKDGQEIVIRVTDAQQTSSNLRDFLKSVTITGAQLVNGKYVVKKGERYGVTLTFKETANLQFDDEATLTYKLPEGVIIPNDTTTTITIAVVSNGKTYEIPAEVKVNKSGTITVKFDETDPNFSKLSSATNVSFKVNLDAEFDNAIDGSEWSDEIDKDIIIDDTDDAEVFVQKTGSYDEKTGKFTYTIKVTATGEVKNVNVKDVISGNALKFNNDVKVSGNSSSYTDNGATNGFDYTFASMKKDETITITYSADVDFSKDTDKDGKITVDQTKNTVTVKPEDGDPHSSEYSREIDFKSTKKNDGKESGTTEDGDKIIDWTIDYNSLALAAAGGDTITDTISAASADYMKYYGDGITVKVYDKSGKLVETRSIKYSELTNYSDSSWTYTIPTSDTTPYRYEISYQTVVDMKKIEGEGKAVTISNTANDSKSDHSVTPGEVTTITKRVAEQTEEYVEWESVIHVPEKGLDTAVVTDTVPSVWAGHVTGENKTIYDEYIKNSLSITGLLSRSTYRCCKKSQSYRPDNHYCRRYGAGSSYCGDWSVYD